jgi:hypothetical protein
MLFLWECCGYQLAQKLTRIRAQADAHWASGGNLTQWEIADCKLYCLRFLRQDGKQRNDRGKSRTVKQDEEFRRRGGSRLTVSKIQRLHFNKATVKAAQSLFPWYNVWLLAT